LSRRKSIPASAKPPGHLKRFGARILDDPRHDPYHDGALTIDFGKDAYEIRVRWER